MKIEGKPARQQLSRRATTKSVYPQLLEKRKPSAISQEFRNSTV
jgi:hypothetical protein